MNKEIFCDEIKSLFSGEEWLIYEENYIPGETLARESLFALSNGYMGTRGAYEEGSYPGLPCTFVNGVFDKSETFMRELCNLPNWLGITFYTGKTKLGVDSFDVEILKHLRILDIKGGFVARYMELQDKSGRKTALEYIRFVSRKNLHRMAVRVYFTPLNYSGMTEIESVLDASVLNFSDAARFKVKHTVTEAVENLSQSGSYVSVATRDVPLFVGEGAFLTVTRGDKDIKNAESFRSFGEKAVEFCDFTLKENETAVITKYASIFTERDVPRDSIKGSVEKELVDFLNTGFDRELLGHKSVYESMWDSADIKIKGDPELNKYIRFTIFHLMSTGNPHDSRINVGAKLLTGEEYGGHAFWDTELFMMPFFACTFPEVAKNLEHYRYFLLDAAKENAAKNGYKGAQYPWESADDGSEQCPDWTIEPDGTCYRCYVAEYEHHVTAAVAYGIYNYVRLTGDKDFLYEKGLEVLLETARFWASRVIRRSDGRYAIHKVTGPDEWHEPVDNNLYTNYLARWNIKYVLSLLKEHGEMFKITEEEREKLSEVADNMYLPAPDKDGIYEEFEGYFNLKDVTIEEYDENDWPKRPKALLEGLRARETTIIKQADVVMLMYLLGHEFDSETIRKNYHYYEKRTLHGSSLSPSIYSIMGLRVGDESKAYRYLMRAASLDILNHQKNTREGIHAANAGGVWQTVVFGFAGVMISEEGKLSVNPRLPKHWKSLSFKLHIRGELFEINIVGDDVEVKTL